MIFGVKGIESELKNRRRAIYTGLRPYFDDVELIAVVKLWEEKYSAKPKYAFTEFLSVICQNKSLKAQRTSILSSILAAVDLPLNQLLPDPFDENQEITTKVNDVASTQINEVFAVFMQNLLQKVSESQEAGVRAFVVTHSEKLTIDLRRKAHLKGWLEKKDASLSVNYDLATIRKVVNFSYVALCEYLGPVKTDQMLAQTIKDTEPFAKEHAVNLHDFL